MPEVIGKAYREFLSTPSARRATCWCIVAAMHQNISIHALREEGDRPSLRATTCHTYFYPRPPRGGRLKMAVSVFTTGEFLSTPSARRATGRQRSLRLLYKISIHALREEGDPCFDPCTPACAPISIHALREEGDKNCKGRI